MTAVHLGPERYQSNRSIRKLLRLAGACGADTFYDLGCGRGQLCVVAVKEFGVRRAVGIELHRGRAAKARRYVNGLGLGRRVEIRNENFWDSDLSDATIAYHGLTESEDDVDAFEGKLSRGARLVALFLPLVGVIPVASDYPFYLMRVPFHRTKSRSRWISSVMFRRSTSEGELYGELDADRDYRYDRALFKRLVRERLSKR